MRTHIVESPPVLAIEPQHQVLAQQLHVQRASAVSAFFYSQRVPLLLPVKFVAHETVSSFRVGKIVPKVKMIAKDEAALSDFFTQIAFLSYLRLLQHRSKSEPQSLLNK